MSDRRPFRLATSSTRMLAGTLVSVAAVVAVVTAISLPWPTLAHEPVQVEALPAASDSVLVCDGGLVSIGVDAADAAGLALAATQSVTSGVLAGFPEPLEESLQSSVSSGENGPLAFTAEPQNRVRTDVAASGATTVTTEDLSGYAASACQPALLESWLVGGSASTGAADLVVVSNPGDVAATVELTVFGADGMITPPGGSEQVLPAKTQRVFPLAGLLLGEESPVVRVTAVGTPVHASLQTSLTRTLVAVGVDQVGSIAQAATEQHVVGVQVAAAPGEGGTSGSSSILRVLSAGASATATVTVTQSGAIDPYSDAQTVPLSEGIPVEVDLGDLAVGTYSVAVSADAPVVAAVRQASGEDEGDDFAWYASAPRIDTPSLFAAPTGPAPVLTLVNDAAEDATVTIVSDDGEFRLELAVPAGSSRSTRLEARTVYQLDPGGVGVRAGLSMSGDGALAGFPIWAADAAALPITVYP
ncbi:DUF5719 family protein [Microbacterium sp. NPDC076911]|uniref:DUF5719 family protein n=1 Tax=Microbacterium sp. NPDC076911 TaxID=3154958 RepID=UPI00341205AF